MNDKIQTTAKSDVLIITRIFDAPRERVWKAWTEPEQIMKWWGPKEFTSPSCKLDFRVGGKYLFCMRAADGKDYYTTGVYKEIVKLEKIVYTDSFADEHGKVVHGSYYGMGDDFPMEMIVTLTFEDIGGKTKMTLKHAGMPGAEMSDMTSQGWNSSFDKLDESLK